MMIWGSGMSGWAMTFMGLGNLLFWGLLIAGVVLLVRRPDRPERTGQLAGTPPTPQQVLAVRYARGDIDDEEYMRRLRVLDDGPPSPAPR
ncbi:SHOCT domain-containing protein [Actinoplanes sp. NPDC051513]|uniref:SHOCT domain-containing protein n=1 Tax=Actinoplanes sp. NPDC051513 TaxID=3363908 RepID=UPI0037879634